VNYTTLTQMGPTRWMKIVVYPGVKHECWVDRHLLERVPKMIQGSPSDSVWPLLSSQVAPQLRRRGDGSVQETFPKMLSFPIYHIFEAGEFYVTDVDLLDED